VPINYAIYANRSAASEYHAAQHDIPDFLLGAAVSNSSVNRSTMESTAILPEREREV
jgi:hypothetical protein